MMRAAHAVTARGVRVVAQPPTTGSGVRGGEVGWRSTGGVWCIHWARQRGGGSSEIAARRQSGGSSSAQQSSIVVRWSRWLAVMESAPTPSTEEGGGEALVG
jgi:hypothetical protein